MNTSTIVEKQPHVDVQREIWTVLGQIFATVSACATVFGLFKKWRQSNAACIINTKRGGFKIRYNPLTAEQSGAIDTTESGNLQLELDDQIFHVRTPGKDADKP